MGTHDRDSVPVVNASWTSVLERKVMLKVNLVLQFVETWRSYILTQQFWSFSWWWTFVQMKISSLRIRLTVGQGAKRKLMSWVGSRVPRPYLEKGFPACFQDGVVLCALVEGLLPGACPRYDVLDPDQKERNLKLVLYLVAKHLGFKPEITAYQILQGDKLSERQLLLLLAHMKTASENLYHPLSSSPAPARSSPHPLDGHRVCSARGMGLMLAVQGRRAAFSVVVGRSEEDLGVVVEIRGPLNTVASVRINERGGYEEKWEEDEAVRRAVSKNRIPLEYRVVGNKISVNYTPLVSGPHHLAIVWQGRHIPGSPYVISVDRSVDVPDQEIWCPMAERGAVLKRTDSLTIGGPEVSEACQESKRRGRIIRKKILKYILKVGGNDVVVEDPARLGEVVNSMKNEELERGGNCLTSEKSGLPTEIPSEGTKNPPNPTDTMNTSKTPIASCPEQTGLNRRVKIDDLCNRKDTPTSKDTSSSSLKDDRIDHTKGHSNTKDSQTDESNMIDNSSSSSISSLDSLKQSFLGAEPKCLLKDVGKEDNGVKIVGDREIVTKGDSGNIMPSDRTCHAVDLYKEASLVETAVENDDEKGSGSSCLSCSVLCNGKYERSDENTAPEKNDGVFRARLAIADMEHVETEPQKRKKRSSECLDSLKNQTDPAAEVSVNEKEVLPYVKQIIETADKLRSGANFKVVESQPKDDVEKVGRHKFDFMFRSKPDKNRSGTEMEQVADFRGSNSSDEDEIFSRSSKYMREKMDNKVNSVREKYLRDYPSDSDSAAFESSKDDRSFSYKLRRCGNMDISADLDGENGSGVSGWGIREDPLDSERGLGDDYPHKAEALFECEHTYPQYDETEDFYPVVNLYSSRIEVQDSVDDDLESDFLQKIEDLGARIKKDDTETTFSGLSASSDKESSANEEDSGLSSKDESGFDQIVFEIHQNDSAKGEARNSQRKRTSWSDKTSLPCIRESSIEGIIDAAGNVTCLSAPTNSADNMNSLVITDYSEDLVVESFAKSSTFSSQSAPSEVYYARLVTVIDDDDIEFDGKGKCASDEASVQTFTPNVSPVKIGHQNSGKSSISLLCASPYHAVSHKNSELYQSEQSGFRSHSDVSAGSKETGLKKRDENDCNSTIQNRNSSDRTEIEPVTKKEENASDSSPVGISGNDKTNHTDKMSVDDGVNAADQKLSPIPSVRKVIEIFQKEMEEPLDKWPSDSDLRKSPRRIICVSKDEDWRSEMEGSRNSAMFGSDVHNGSKSIRDRVRLFECENPKQNQSKMKHAGATKTSPTSTVVDKKRYWENFSH